MHFTHTHYVKCEAIIAAALQEGGGEVSSILCRQRSHPRCFRRDKTLSAGRVLCCQPLSDRTPASNIIIMNQTDNIAISRRHASVCFVCEGGGSSLRGGHPHRNSVREEAACGALVSTVWIVCFSVHLRWRCQQRAMCSVGWEVRCQTEINCPGSISKQLPHSRRTCPERKKKTSVRIGSFRDKNRTRDLCTRADT